MIAVEKAVERAVEECIKEGVLADFLIKNRSEAMRMSILEFDEEREMKLIRKAEYEDGLEEGEARGKAEGKAEGELKMLISIVRKKLTKGNSAEEIADILDLDGDQVSRMISYIESNSTSSDDEIALKMIAGMF